MSASYEAPSVRVPVVLFSGQGSNPHVFLVPPVYAEKPKFTPVTPMTTQHLRFLLVFPVPCESLTAAAPALQVSSPCLGPGIPAWTPEPPLRPPSPQHRLQHPTWATATQPRLEAATCLTWSHQWLWTNYAGLERRRRLCSKDHREFPLWLSGLRT